MSASAGDLLERARRRIHRVGPHELQGIVAEGGLIVDIRPDAQRRDEGSLPGALIVERNVLEWRFDPTGSSRLPEARGTDQPVVIVCSEGYASAWRPPRSPISATPEPRTWPVGTGPGGPGSIRTARPSAGDLRLSQAPRSWQGRRA